MTIMEEGSMLTPNKSEMTEDANLSSTTEGGSENSLDGKLISPLSCMLDSSSTSLISNLFPEIDSQVLDQNKEKVREVENSVSSLSNEQNINTGLSQFDQLFLILQTMSQTISNNNSNVNMKMDQVNITLCNNTDTINRVQSQIDENNVTLKACISESISENNFTLKASINKLEESLIKTQIGNNKMQTKMDINNASIMNQLKDQKKETSEQIKNLVTGINNITCNIDSIDILVQDFKIEMFNVQDKMKKNEEEVMEELKRLNIDMERIDRIEVEVDTLSKELKNKIEEENEKINKVILSQKEDLDTKMSCLRVYNEDKTNKIRSEIKFAMSIDKQQTDKSIERLGDEMRSKLQIESTNSWSDKQIKEEVKHKIEQLGNDIIALQDTMSDIQLRLKEQSRDKINVQYKNNRYRSRDTLDSDNELLPPKEKLIANPYCLPKEELNSHNFVGSRIITGRPQTPLSQDSAFTGYSLNEHQRRETYRLSRFMKHDNAPVFTGYNTTAPQFLTELEVFFKTIEVRDDRLKLRVVNQFLKDNPLEWWKITSKEIHSWTNFKEKFLLQFFGEYEIQRLENEWTRLNCRPHYDVERFVLRAFKLQTILKGNTDINKQCHNIIQKLPLSLRDFLALKTYASETDFLQNVKEAMRIKDYIYYSNNKSQQRYDYYQKGPSGYNYSRNDRYSGADSGKGSQKSMKSKSYQGNRYGWDNSNPYYNKRYINYDNTRFNNSGNYYRNNSDYRNDDRYRERNRDDRNQDQRRDRDNTDRKDDRNYRITNNRDRDNRDNTDRRDDRNYRSTDNRDSRNTGNSRNSGNNNARDSTNFRNTRRCSPSANRPRNRSRSRDRPVNAVLENNDQDTESNTLDSLNN